MKKMTIAGILCLGIFISCGGVKQMKKKSPLTISPEKLELFVNQRTDPYTIRVNYTLNVPAGYVPNRGRVIYTPYFTNGNRKYELKQVIITGKKYDRPGKRSSFLPGKNVIPNKVNALQLTSNGDGMKIKLTEIVPFELWMSQAKLMADVSLESGNRKTKLYDMILADGIIYMPLGPGPVRVKYVKEQVMEPARQEVWFLYPTDDYIFMPEYRGNRDRMQEMMKWLNRFRTDTSVHLNRIVITGSSSPSGNWSYNEQLALRRAEQMKQRLVERAHWDKDLIVVKSIPEDWKRLRELVEQSDLPDKEAVLRIWNEQQGGNRRIEMLRKLPQYEYLATHLFPQLQRVTCLFEYTRRKAVTHVEPE